MAVTLFDRCGGFSTVRKIVSSFYDKILDSENLQGYFANTDMRRLIDHQTKFIASVMDGPASYTDEVLQRVHAPLNISHADFLEMADLLRESLEDADLAPDDVRYVCDRVLKREPYIVARRA